MRKFFVNSRPVVAAALILLGAFGTAGAETLRAPGGGTIRALVVGINVYRNLPKAVWLKGAEPDARDIDDALAADGVHATFLPDEKATRKNIVDAMNGLVRDSKPGDLVFISYAGHGMQTPEYSDWKGIDPSGVNEQIALEGFSLAGDGALDVIVNEEMRAWLSRLDAKGVDTLVVMDSCYGGGMRDVDPRSGEIPLRVLHDHAADGDRAKFVGIEMTKKEARADIEAMPHVTFLGGATETSVVPEMRILGSPTPRGALSYFVARALRGQAAVDGVVTRKSLFDFILQNVPQATHDRQFVAVHPTSEETDVIDRQLFLFGDSSTPTPAPEPKPSATLEPAKEAKPESAEDGIRLAIVGGQPGDWSKIERGAIPLMAAPDAAAADLVWDAGKSEAVANGDLVMQSVDGSMIGAVADRTWTIRKLRELSQSRGLTFHLESGGALLGDGEVAEAEAEGLRAQHLTVFNIGADGTLQMLYPAAPREKGHCSDPDGDQWSCGLRVGKPYGADTIVGLATTNDPSEFVAWLKSHHGKLDAALLPAELGRVLDADAAARLGFAGVFTNSKR